MQHCWLWSWSKRPQEKECGSPLEARKNNEIDLPWSLQQGAWCCWHLDFSQWDPCQTSDLPHCKVINVSSSVTKCVVICYSSHLRLIPTPSPSLLPSNSVQVHLVETPYVSCRTLAAGDSEKCCFQLPGFSTGRQPRATEMIWVPVMCMQCSCHGKPWGAWGHTGGYGWQSYFSCSEGWWHMVEQK